MNNKVTLWFFLILALFSPAAKGQTITFASLLKEMGDPVQVARFPAIPYQQLEVSSYNRASTSPFKKGWFADSDGLGYIREETIDDRKEYVIMEHKGPGCITRMWTPYFYYNLNDHNGPDIRIYIDGRKEPVIRENFIRLLTGNAFVHFPFAGLTARAGVCYLPIPFQQQCKITLDKPPFYYCINYRAYSSDIPVVSYSGKDRLASSALLKQTTPKLLGTEEKEAGDIESRMTYLHPGDSLSWPLPAGTRVIRNLGIQLKSKVRAQALGKVLLKIMFDGRTTVCCPLGDFFCIADTAGSFHTRHLSVEGDTLRCEWPMPYQSKATITLVNYSGQPVDLSLETNTAPWQWDRSSMYFHAGWCNYEYLPGDRFFDLNFVHIKGKGVLAGDALTVLSPGKGWWGEGDEKIYSSRKDVQRHFPSLFGTGTEDYYGWAGGVVPTGKDTFSIPFGANVKVGNPDNPRGFNVCMRDRLLDAIPFEDELKFDMEASPGVDIRHGYDLLAYSMVTYWYALPGAVSNREPDDHILKEPRITLHEMDSLEQRLKAGATTLDTQMVRKRVEALSDLSP